MDERDEETSAEGDDRIIVTVAQEGRPPNHNEFLVTKTIKADISHHSVAITNSNLSIMSKMEYTVGFHNNIRLKTQNQFVGLFSIKTTVSPKKGKGTGQIVIIETKTGNLRIEEFDKTTFIDNDLGNGEQSLQLRKGTCNLCHTAFTIKGIHETSEKHNFKMRVNRLADIKKGRTKDPVKRGLFLTSDKTIKTRWEVTPETYVFPLNLYADLPGNLKWLNIVYHDKTQGIELVTQNEVTTYANLMQVINMNEQPIRRGINKSGTFLRVNLGLPLKTQIAFIYELQFPEKYSYRFELEIEQGITKDFHLEPLEISQSKKVYPHSDGNSSSHLGENYLRLPKHHELVKLSNDILTFMEAELNLKNPLCPNPIPLNDKEKEKHVEHNWRILQNRLDEENYIEKLTLLIYCEHLNYESSYKGYKLQSVNSVAGIPDTPHSRVIVNIRDSNLDRLNLKPGYQVGFITPERSFTGNLELMGENSCSFRVYSPPEELKIDTSTVITRLNSKFLCYVYVTSLKLVQEKGLLPYLFPTTYTADDSINLSPKCYQKLSQDQQETVKKLMNHNPVVPFIITGPAGSGKSRVILEAVLQLLTSKPFSKILLVNPTNHGISDLHRKLNLLLEEHLDQKFAALKIASPQQPKRADCKHCFLNEEKSHHEYPPKEYICKFAVLICTPTIALRLGHIPGLNLNLSAIIIDEACFLTEPETVSALAPHLKAGTQNPLVILAGDVVQLTYQPRSSCAKLGQYGNSTMKRLSYSDLYQNSDQIYVKMSQSYRNPPVIVELMNELAYQGQVQSAVTSHSGGVLAFHTTSTSKKARGDSSYYNGAEAATCLHYADEYQQAYPELSIVILCCYTAQVAIFKQLQATKFPQGQESRRYKVLTTETVQGSEADIVFLCPTVHGSYPKGPEGYSWPANINRLTMCVSRAKNMFILVGDLLLLNCIPPFKMIIDKARKTEGLVCQPNIHKLLLHDIR